MISPRELLAKLRDWARRDRLDGELAEELRFHRQHLERDGGNARRLGNVTRIREQARELWSIPWLDQFFQDVRHALRGLRRSPGFAATVIVTLGLGIGANAAMFGIIDRLMFRPFPGMRDPGTAHRVYLMSYDRGELDINSGTEYTRYLDFRKWTSSFSTWSAFASLQLAVGNGEAAREQRVAAVSGDFWSFFDVRPALGRFFVPAEDQTPRGADVVVLGYDYWQAEFGGRDVLGQVVNVGNVAATIVGVAPKGFMGLSESFPPAMYLPITTYAGARLEQHFRTTYYTRYNYGWMSMMARRKAGVTEEAASADLTQAYIRSWNAEREFAPGNTPAEIAKPQAMTGPMRSNAGPNRNLESRTAMWVGGVAVIVLLIACANVANLFLARGLRRQREIAVRLALGVSRRRLIMQALTESLVLSLFGCGAGLLVAQWGGAAIRGLLLSGTAVREGVLTDWRTLAVGVVVALAAGIITGLVPALLAGRGDLAHSLKAGSREGTYQRSRLRGTLLVTQAALSVMLLAGAALFVRSLEKVKGLRFGYDAPSLVHVERVMRGVVLDTASTLELGRTLLATARAIPGVESASLITAVPLASISGQRLAIPGIDSVDQLGDFTYQNAGDDYFRTMGTRILRGRGFTGEDRAGAPLVIVVSESMARVVWPGRDAIGQCVKIGGASNPCSTVVGVAEDIIQDSDEVPAGRSKRLHYYLAYEQSPQPLMRFRVLIRLRGDAAAQREVVRKALQPVMPGNSYVSIQAMNDRVESTRRSWRLGATMFVAFGVLALVVAAIGLYGVISYNVAQRMHELGVRVALGAQRRDIVRLVASQGLRFAAAGIAAGTLLSLAVSRWIQPLLFQQSARDPLVYALVAAVLLAVALVACAAPSWRASAADPNAALRAE